MMKRCQDCDFQHEALLDNCWQCGSRAIVWENAGNVPQSMQATQVFRSFQSETPTVFAAQFNPNANTNGFNYATNNYQTPGSSAGHKILLAVAGLFTFFLLFSVVGAATYFKFIKRPVTRVENFTPTKEEEKVKETEKVRETEKVKETETTSTNNSRTGGTSTTTKKSNGKESAELERMWVDYNVRENGRLGMRIHVKFKAYNMKNMRSYLGIYFEKRDGTHLTTKNKKFASTDGQVAIYYFLTPGYDAAVYDDVELFMPYDELNLGRGKFNLTMSADVIYEKGGLIEHLKDYDFIYEEK